MPYIKQEVRNALDLAYNSIINAGELNYLITMLVRNYLGTNSNYEKFNSAIGALESAKLELYRRMIAPYEDKKIKENGDVY